MVWDIAVLFGNSNRLAIALPFLITTVSRNRLISYFFVYNSPINSDIQCLYFIEPPADGEVRLAYGDNEREGRIEIWHGSKWGTVCNDDFTEVDAAVVCFQLGFTDAVAVVAEYGQFGEGDGPIYLDNVDCDGSESQLSEC